MVQQGGSAVWQMIVTDAVWWRVPGVYGSPAWCAFAHTVVRRCLCLNGVGLAASNAHYGVLQCTGGARCATALKG